MTTPQEYDDLVMRLEATTSLTRGNAVFENILINRDGPEAAAAITALQLKIIDLQNLLHETRDVLGSERDAAVEALQPFAEEACVWDDKVPDTFMPESIGTYTIGDLRRAYRIVASKKEEV